MEGKKKNEKINKNLSSSFSQLLDVISFFIGFTRKKKGKYFESINCKIVALSKLKHGLKSSLVYDDRFLDRSSN